VRCSTCSTCSKSPRVRLTAKELLTIVKPKKPWSEMTDEEKHAIAAVMVSQINAGRSTPAE
jgi:hypothetical protein